MILFIVTTVLVVGFIMHVMRVPAKHRVKKQVSLPNWLYMAWIATIAVLVSVLVVMYGTK